MKLERYLRFSFPVFFGIYVLAFMGMPPYIDDYNRLSADVLALANQGRLFTEYSYTLLQGFNLKFLPDLYYFCLVFIFFSTMASYKFVLSKSDPKGFWLVTAFFFSVYSSPALIQNISFHIDSIGMYTAINTAIISGFYVGKTKVNTFVASTLLLCFSTICYQLSFNYYIISLFASIFIRCVSGTESSLRGAFIHAITKSLPLFISIIFALYIKHKFMTNAYIDQHSQFASFSQLSTGILSNNINKYFDIILGSFNKLQIYCIYLSAIIYIVTLIMLFGKSSKDGNSHVAASAIALPFVFFSMMLIPSMVLVSPVLEQRAIPIYSSLFFVAISPLIVIGNRNALILYAPFVVLLITVIMTVAAFTASQAYNVERNLDLMKRIYANAPEEFMGKDGSLDININSDTRPDYIGVSKRNIAYFPALKYLMRDYFSSNYASYMFNNYYDTGLRVKWVTGDCNNQKFLKQSYKVKYYTCDGVLHADLK